MKKEMDKVLAESESEIKVEFDERLMHSDNVLTNELIVDFITTSKEGTDKWLYSTRIGTIKASIPVYYDVWLRYNKEQGFIDIYSADEDNKCYTPCKPNDYFSVPEHIQKRMKELVLKDFMWQKNLNVEEWHMDEGGSFKKKTREKSNIEKA